MKKGTNHLIAKLKKSNADSSGSILEEIIKVNGGFLKSIIKIKSFRYKLIFIKKQFQRSFWYSNRLYFKIFFIPIISLIRIYEICKLKFYLRWTAHSIYIYREIGGLGDLVMLTPTIHALLSKYPELNIDLYIPRKYFSIFDNIERIRLFDYKKLNKKRYKLGYALSGPCPAGLYESSNYPNVKLSRREIFSKFFGMKLKNYKPNIKITQEEIKKAKEILNNKDIDFNKRKIISIQLHCTDKYRDYPYMYKLVKRIIKEFNNVHVITFGLKNKRIYQHAMVKHFTNLKLKELFGLIYLSNLIVAPDSSLVHIAAAFDKTTIALFGPTDHKQRLKHYPFATAITSNYNCIPCWRNPKIPCKISKKDKSICMYDIKIDEVIEKIRNIL